MKAKAVAKAGTPANASLYLAHVDDYLAKVDKLDDATRAQFGTDYAFIFQYLYPRVQELRGSGTVSPIDLINQLTALNEAGGTTGASTGTAPSASETAVNSAFREVLLRDPDSGGLMYWKNQVDNGTFNASTLPLGMACAAKDAAGSEGASAKAWLAKTGKGCGAAATGTATGTGTAVTNAEALVNAAYLDIFARTPDAAELRYGQEIPYWKLQLESGALKADDLPRAMACAGTKMPARWSTTDSLGTAIEAAKSQADNDMAKAWLNEKKLVTQDCNALMAILVHAAYRETINWAPPQYQIELLRVDLDMHKPFFYPCAVARKVSIIGIGSI